MSTSESREAKVVSLANMDVGSNIDRFVVVVVTELGDGSDPCLEVNALYRRTAVSRRQHVMVKDRQGIWS